MASLDAWLGVDHGLTDSQIADLEEIADDIYARYVTVDPDADDPEQIERDLAQATEAQRDEALAVAYRLMTEPADLVVGELARDLAAIRAAEARALAGIRQAARQLVQPGDRSARGLRTLAGFAAAAGVTRQAVYPWLETR